MQFEIVFYEKADGTEPAKDFMLSLDTKMRAKMFRTVELLRDKGNDLREPLALQEPGRVPQVDREGRALLQHSASGGHGHDTRGSHGL